MFIATIPLEAVPGFGLMGSSEGHGEWEAPSVLRTGRNSMQRNIFSTHLPRLKRAFPKFGPDQTLVECTAAMYVIGFCL